MAVISLPGGENWFVARWLFLYFLEKMKDDIPSDKALHKVIQDGINNGCYWLDIKNVSTEELKIFRGQVLKLYEMHKMSGRNSLANPEFFDGFIERLEELLELMER